jgi:hypothetical protein
MPGDRFLVPLQDHAPRVLLLSRSEQTGALDLCKIEKVLVDPGAGTDALVLDDDDTDKEALLNQAAPIRWHWNGTQWRQLPVDGPLHAIAIERQHIDVCITGLTPQLQDVHKLEAKGGMLWSFGFKDLVWFDGKR